MQETITRRSRAAATAACVAAAMLAVAAPARADEGDDHDGKALQGTWRVQVTTRDCATQAPVLSFAAMLSFARGGTMSGTTSSPAFKPGQRTSDYGVWSAREGGGYRAVSEAFLLFDSAAPPLSRGVQRLTQWIDVDGDVFHSDARVKFFDASGAPLVSGCATAVGTRMK